MQTNQPPEPQPAPVTFAPAPFAFDALLPREMAGKAEAAGVAKATLGKYRMFALAVLAGAFIALGAIFATTVSRRDRGRPALRRRRACWSVSSSAWA